MKLERKYRPIAIMFANGPGDGEHEKRKCAYIINIDRYFNNVFH